MKKILLVQSRENAKTIVAEQCSYMQSVGESERLVFLSSLDTDPDWGNPRALLTGMDGIILGGSGDFDLHGGREENDPARVGARAILERLTPLITYACEQHIPILGVCFGHQLIAEVYGGEIMSDDAQKKVGSHHVRLTEHAIGDPLFHELPQFAAQYAHADAVTTLPHGATLLASSPSCRFSVLRYGPRAYSTQFHPELSASEIIERMKNGSRYLPKDVTIESITKESPEASTILQRFVEKIVVEK